LKLNKNADISIFLKKMERIFALQISLDFAFTYRKANTFKNYLWYVFNNKIVATALLAPLTAFFWFSQNTV